MRRALVPLNQLNTASEKSTKTLPPFLSRLARLFRTMRQPFVDLREIVALKGPGNDAVDQMRQQPSLTSLAKKTVANNVKALKSGQPVVEFLRPYAPDMASWIAHFAQVPAYYDANGHYARVLPIFSAFSFDQVDEHGQRALAERAPVAGQEDAQPLLPRRRHPARSGQLQPVPRQRQARLRRLRPGGEAARTVSRRIAIGAVAAALLVALIVALGAGGGDDGGTYKVRAIFNNGSYVIPGEDVKVAGAKVGVVDDLEVTKNLRAAAVLQIDEAASRTSARTPHARSGSSR